MTSLHSNYSFTPKTRQKEKSRIRTKLRPEFENLLEVFVVTVDKGRYTAIDKKNNTYFCVKNKKTLKTEITVGDIIKIIPEKPNNENYFSRIISVNKRKSFFYRSKDDYSDIIKQISANQDLVLILTSITNPEPDINLIIRIKLACFKLKTNSLVLFTKNDLASSETLQKDLSKLGLESVSYNQNSTLENIQSFLNKKITTLIGLSGVGKSSLVNRLSPTSNRKTSLVNKIGLGKHTSTQSLVVKLEDNTWIIDTPGIRSFGINFINKEDFHECFPQLRIYQELCPKGCKHEVGTKNICNVFNNLNTKIATALLNTLESIEKINLNKF